MSLHRHCPCFHVRRRLEPIGVTNLGDYPVVVHGTNPKAWASIKVTGLNRMGRQHVHFAKGLPGEGGVISGMRKGSEVMVHLDLAGAVRDGIPFFVSANGVVLSPGEGDTGVVPAKYFKVRVGSTGAPENSGCWRVRPAFRAPRPHKG